MIGSEQQRELAANWTRAQPLVFSFLRSAVGTAEIADELVQRVALVLVDKYGQYDPERPFTAWALGVARFELLNYRRQNRTERLMFTADVIEQIASEAEDMGPDLSQMRVVLDKCIKKLSPRRQEVLNMRYLEQHGNDEIAGRLGIGKQSVTVLLSRIRASLRRCIRQSIGVGEEWL